MLFSNALAVPWQQEQALDSSSVHGCESASQLTDEGVEVRDKDGSPPLTFRCLRSNVVAQCLPACSTRDVWLAVTKGARSHFPCRREDS